MKIEYTDKLVIYINNKYLENKNIDFNNIESCLKEICESLNENYKIKLKGLYNIDIYIDTNYGIVLELEKEDLDIDDYFDQIDMQIIIHKEKFLLEINNLDSFYNHKIYIYRNKYYSDYLNIEMGNLIYKTSNILKKAKVIEI